MNREEMIDRYSELYDRMSGSGDVRNMRMFGEAERSVRGTAGRPGQGVQNTGIFLPLVQTVKGKIHSALTIFYIIKRLMDCILIY